MRKNKRLLPVIIILALGVISSSSGLSDIQKTGGSRGAYFHLQGNGDLEICYRKLRCHQTSVLIFFSERSPDDVFYLRLKFANGDTERLRRTPECGSSNWVSVHISQKGFRIGNDIVSFGSDRSKRSLQGANLTVSSTYEMEWRENTATTPAPSVSIPVVLGSVGSGVLILALIITTAVICYRKKRQNQRKAPDDGEECQDYEDVTNTVGNTYTYAMNTEECIYDNADGIYSDPDCVYEEPGNFMVNLSQGGQLAKFQPSG